MLAELFDRMGYDIKIEIYPFARAIKMVNDGERQAIFCFPGQTDPRVTVATIPLYYASNVFIYKKSRFPEGVNFKTLSDLKGYKAGNLIGSQRWTKLLEEAGLKVTHVSSDEFNLRKLDAERIDFVPAIYLTARALLELHFPGREDGFGFTQPFEFSPVPIYFSTTYPGNQEIIDDVNKKLESADLYDILQKHYGKYFPNGRVPHYTATGKLNPQED
jgi:ABC-type amino acid transport substrate-binding protein